MMIPFKSDSDALEKMRNFSGNVFDLLPEDHDCFVFKEIFKQLDTSSVEAKFSPIGQHAFHPRKIVGILIYGYTHGVFSSRELEKRCNEDLSFMYIADGNCPNFRVLNDFRKNNPEFFKECFKQSVKLAMEMNPVSLGNVCLDGSKFKADSSKHKAMSYGRLKEKEQELCEEIEALLRQANACDNEEDADYGEKTGDELPEELKFKEQRLEKVRAAKEALEAREKLLNPGKPIDDKKQISFADTDARIMGKNGDFDYRYNPQISVDSEFQIIVGQHVSQNANDKQEVKTALESIEKNTGRLPEKMTMDNGYESGDNLKSLDDSKVEGYIATGRDEKSASEGLDESNRRVVKADFIYDPDQDCFHCPGGQILELRNKDKHGTCVYQGEAEVCSGCRFHERCCQSKKGEARTINTDCHEDLRREMRERMEQEESKEIYKQRKSIVEPVFGQIKNGGFRGFNVRGKEKVDGEFSLVCAAHNIKKTVKAIMTGLVRPEFEEAAV